MAIVIILSLYGIVVLLSTVVMITVGKDSTMQTIVVAVTMTIVARVS